MNNMKTIFPLLLWLLSIIRCCGKSPTELKSFHGNSAWEIVETSEYGVLFLITYFLILMWQCKHHFFVNREEVYHRSKYVTPQQLKPVEILGI